MIEIPIVTAIVAFLVLMAWTAWVAATAAGIAIDAANLDQKKQPCPWSTCKTCKEVRAQLDRLDFNVYALGNAWETPRLWSYRSRYFGGVERIRLDAHTSQLVDGLGE